MYIAENCSYDPNAELAAFNSGHVTAGFFPEGSSGAALEMELQHQHQQQLAYNNSWQYNQSHVSEPLLNLFHHFPACSPATSSLTFANSPSPSPLPYDPLLHLNLPPQPPLFGFSSLPGAGFSGLGTGEGDGIYGENGGGMVFASERALPVERSAGRGTKHFTSERHRRVQMKDTYTTLRELVPNPTKIDRASIVADAISYIKELGRTVNELKSLVEKKRRGGGSTKKFKPAGAGDSESSNIKPEPEQYPHIRSSWLQRKSKDTEVDVRIIEDEVTIKLVQRKKINLLLTASRVIDELQLDLRHVAGGHVGDTYSYLFNMKIGEDSSLYASVAANKLIDVLNRQYAAVQPQAFTDGV